MTRWLMMMIDDSSRFIHSSFSFVRCSNIFVFYQKEACVDFPFVLHNFCVKTSVELLPGNIRAKFLQISTIVGEYVQ